MDRLNILTIIDSNILAVIQNNSTSTEGLRIVIIAFIIIIVLLIFSIINSTKK